MEKHYYNDVESTQIALKFQFGPIQKLFVELNLSVLKFTWRRPFERRAEMI